MFEPPFAPTPISKLTEKPTLEMVKAAIKVALSHDPAADRDAASKWLEALKHSIYAWEICDQLLAANEGVDISYLAAHMLRQKITRHFNELPIEYYSSLKDSILNHLQTNEDYAIQGQLTLAIADLTLLLQVWQNPIEDLAKQFGLDVGLMSIANNDYVAIYKALHNRLIFANILHQMCDLNHNHTERPWKIGAKRREEYEDYLISKCSQAIIWWLNTLKEIEEVTAIFSADSNTKQDAEMTIKDKNFELMEKLTGQIYLCYSAWLRIFDEENVNDSLVIIEAAFKHLGNLDCNDTIHKYAVEVVTATANFCEDNMSVDYLVNNLVAHVYDLEPIFRQSISREDLVKTTNFVRIFTTVAETACLTHVIYNKDFKLIEMLLDCLKHYDYDIVEETYSFWWMLLEHLQNRLSQNDYAPYINYINKFIMAVVRLSRFDPDEDSVVTDDQDIINFRAESAEIITNVMFITTAEEFLKDVQILQYVKFDSSTLSWEKVESILWLLSLLVPVMSKDEDHVKLEILNTILTQQTFQDIQTLMQTKQVTYKIGYKAGEIHPQIISTSLKVIGSMESFLAEHPDYLALVIRYIEIAIGTPIHNKHLLQDAATTLCNILESKCQFHFAEYSAFYKKIIEYCNTLDQFKDQAGLELLKCCGFLANTIKQLPVKDQFLQEVIAPTIKSLMNAVEGTPEPEEDVTSEYLDRLSMIFRHTRFSSQELPEMKLLNDEVNIRIWPTILKVLKLQAPKSHRSIERSCRTIRYIIRCIKPEWMINEIALTMIDLYKAYPQNSSPLYICSILVDEFGNKSPSINVFLFAVLENLCQFTFALLRMDGQNLSQTEGLANMRNYPETVDDLMRLFTRFLKKCPTQFVTCKALEDIIHLSISSLRLDHQDVNLNVIKFVNAFLELGTGPEAGQGTEYWHIQEAIKNILGARFTDAVIKACLFDIPPSLISGEVEILSTLYNFDGNLFNTWVEATVRALPTTNIQGVECVTPDQLEEFKMTITTAGGNMKKMVNCLRAFARLYT